jgi:hypothetical protein
MYGTPTPIIVLTEQNKGKRNNIYFRIDTHAGNPNPGEEPYIAMGTVLSFHKTGISYKIN